MNARPISKVIALLALSTQLLWLTTPSWADPVVSLSGFGTLGYAISDASDVEYRIGGGSDGVDDSGSFKLNPYLTGTFQALSRQNYAGKFTPEVEWLFLKGQVSDSAAVRIGRIGTPFFMVSDFREVGYANTTLRAPENTYVLAPLRTIDGIDVNCLFEFGNILVSGQAFFGEREQNFRDESVIILKDVMGANIAFERGVARLRFSYVDTSITVRSDSYDQFKVGLEQAAQLVPQLAVAAEDFNGKSKRTTFAGVGLELDMAPWFVVTEYTQRRAEKSFVSSVNGAYLTAGFRWNNLTPYVTVSDHKQVSKTGIDFPPVPQIAPLAAGLAAAYAPVDQSAVALGLRWDLFNSAALKFQFENISRDVIGASFLPKDSTNQNVNSDDVKLFSVAMDFTF